MRRPSPLLVWSVLCGVLCLGGCQKETGLIPVRGRITFDGQDMPSKGYLRFVPLKVDDGFQRRPGIAPFETDGYYQAKSFQPGDGLYPGEYAVYPYCWEVEPGIGGPPAKSYLSDRYADPRNPAFRVNVLRDASSIEFNLDVKP